MTYNALELRKLAEQTRHNEALEGVERAKVPANYLGAIAGAAGRVASTYLGGLMKKAHEKNDVAWYKKAGAMQENASTHIPTTEVYGVELVCDNCPQYDILITPAAVNRCEAATLTMFYYPTLGNEGAPDYDQDPNSGSYDIYDFSAIETDANQLYNVLRGGNTAARNYEAPDAMMVILASYSILELCADIERALDCIGYYSQWNNTYGDVMLRGLDINVSDAIANRATYIERYNAILKSLAFIKVPGNMSVLERRIFLNSVILQDTAEVKTQFYMYVPLCVYEWSDDYNYLNPVDIHGQTVPALITNLLDELEIMIKKLKYSSIAGEVFADIFYRLKDQIIRMPTDYKPEAPRFVVDPITLEQVRNSDIVGRLDPKSLYIYQLPTMQANGFKLVQGVLHTGIGTNVLRNRLGLCVNSPEGTASASRFVNKGGRERYFFTNHSFPDGDIILEDSRNCIVQSMLKKIPANTSTALYDYFDAATGNTTTYTPTTVATDKYYWFLDSTDTIVCRSAVLNFFSNSGTTGVTSLTLNTNPTSQIEYNGLKYVDLTQFGFLPYYVSMPAGTGVVACDCENTLKLARSDLKKLLRLSILSQFSLGEFKAQSVEYGSNTK